MRPQDINGTAGIRTHAESKKGCAQYLSVNGTARLLFSTRGLWTWTPPHPTPTERRDTGGVSGWGM